MPRILIVHPALDDAHPLDLPIARLVSGLAAKAEVTLLLVAGQAEGAAAKALTPKVRLVTATKTSKARGGRALIGALPPLVQRLKAGGFDTVLATGRDMGWLAAAARIAAGRPGRLLVKLDRPPALGFGGALAKRVQATVFGEAARVLVPSDADRRTMTAAFPGQAPRFLAVAEPYVPDGGKPPPPPRRKGDQRRIVAALPLTKNAGLDTLLATLADAPREARLTIVGDGPIDVAKAAARVGIGDRVEAAPAGPLAPHLRDADLFVLPKALEALPPALIEALAADRAVIATDSFASARDLLDGAPGCAVVRPNDPVALAAAITAALAHGPRPSLRPIAERHGVAAAVQAHGWAMGVL